MSKQSHSILIATHNSHKIEEIRSIMEPATTSSISNITVISPKGILGFPDDIEETGMTLEENAYIKAKAVFDATGQTCMADDTGLEVDALDGKPGVFSARYAGENASFADNRLKLLEALQDISEEEKRTARFRTVMCYVSPLRTLFSEGICEGVITHEELGEKGFGYDAIFRPINYTQTFAQLPAEEKNSLSHRGKAVRSMVDRLSPFLAE
jgi:XTP/dITP diphosphohydrolase